MIKRHAAQSTSPQARTVPLALPTSDVLDDALSLTDIDADTDEDPDGVATDLASDEERNSTGGALPSSDDGDNDNDDDDARERALPDHLRRDPDDQPN